jgi:hypothetical protein
MMWGKSGMKRELGWVDMTSRVEQDSKNQPSQTNILLHCKGPQFPKLYMGDEGKRYVSWRDHRTGKPRVRQVKTWLIQDNWWLERQSDTHIKVIYKRTHTHTHTHIYTHTHSLTSLYITITEIQWHCTVTLCIFSSCFWRWCELD